MTDYVTLVTSLPHLPHFTAAKRLPINRERLEQRLSMLTGPDRDLVERAEHLLRWQRQPLNRPDRQIVQRYMALTADPGAPPVLRTLVKARMDLRLLLGAMRRRRRGEGAPGPQDPWAKLPLMVEVRRNWSRPDFGLKAPYPWLPQLKRLLDGDDALATEEYLMDIVWQTLERLKSPGDFSLDAVLIYLFQWDLVARWMTHAADPAAQRFAQLVEEATGDHVQHFV